MLQTLRGWNFQIFRNQLEEWLLNDLQTETGNKSMAFSCLLRLCYLRCLGFWPFFEATKKKKFRFFRHNRLDGAQEWRWPFRYRFLWFPKLPTSEVCHPPKGEVSLERFRFFVCFVGLMFLARWLGDILVDGYVTNGCTASGGQAIEAGCVARIFRTARDKN